jgi:hypothetical protein
MNGPHLSELGDFWHIVIVGNSTFSIGNDVESKTSMTGSSIHTKDIIQICTTESMIFFTIEKF